jgi:catechol 2,3-dioxygenase-like lactoylglutathione lyase family enzyme
MSIIKIEDIAHVRFAAPDLAVMQSFLSDFGLHCFESAGRLYGKGNDGRPFLHVTETGPAKFLGFGLRAQSVDDLECLARHEGVVVEDLKEPGGGKVVRLTDPDGYRLEIVAGQTRSEAMQLPVEPLRNTAGSRSRLRARVRLEPSPSHVCRIGHAVLKVSNFRVSETWYKERFGFITSDEVEAAKDVPIGAFMRCDRGDKPADHHTLFLAEMPGAPALAHAAFEVASLDDLMLGHQHLKSRRREAVWGVGRHIMGSQVFDYWKDPFGNELEHWTDGDLFTSADVPQKMPLTSLLAVQWGSPHPAMTGSVKPPLGMLSWLAALMLRIRRLFSANAEGTRA